MSLELSESLGALISPRMRVLQVDRVRPQGFKIVRASTLGCDLGSEQLGLHPLGQSHRPLGYYSQRAAEVVDICISTSQLGQHDRLITLQKFPGIKVGSLSAMTSPFTLPKVV